MTTADVTVPARRTVALELTARTFRLGVGLLSTAVGAFLVFRIRAWPPHEDEALALLIGRRGLGDVLDAVLGERGGAPLHFVAAWAVAHAGGGLTELRLVSAAAAVASVPVVAALAERLAGRAVALVATTLASTSWMLLFHGAFARMYALFLLAATLSYLAVLAAVRRGGGQRWTAWGAAALATVAAHPYGALVVASQAVFAWRTRARAREAVPAFAVVAALAAPLWSAYAVLAHRFDAGVELGGEQVGGPFGLARYLGHVAGDLSSGWPLTLPVVLALAVGGAVLLGRSGGAAPRLAAAALATPTIALLLVRAGGHASPETRHLIFLLPFLATLVALPVVRVWSREPMLAAGLATALVASQLAWAWSRTPELFTGEASEARRARADAAAWLARTSRADDVLLGYEPVYLLAWERTSSVPRTVVPRADAELAADALAEGRHPLGRGVWVLDGTDAGQPVLPERSPGPAFEARGFGPLVVVRSRRPALTPQRFVRQTLAVERVGVELGVEDAQVNYDTARETLAVLAREHGLPSGTPSR